MNLNSTFLNFINIDKIKRLQMYFYTYIAGVLSGVLLHRYKWKLGFLALKGVVKVKTGLVSYFNKRQSVIIPTAVDGVNEYVFKSSSNENSSGNDDYKKVYLIGNDVNAFKDEKEMYFSQADEFLCCFLKSVDNDEELLDVSSQLKKSIFYVKSSPSVRSEFSVQMFLDVCQFENHLEIELLWIDKELNEKTKKISKNDKEMDVYYLFNE